MGIPVHACNFSFISFCCKEVVAEIDKRMGDRTDEPEDRYSRFESVSIVVRFNYTGRAMCSKQHTYPKTCIGLKKSPLLCNE